MTIDQAKKVLAVNRQQQQLMKEQQVYAPMVTWSEMVNRAKGVMEGLLEAQEREQQRAENNGLGRSTLELALELQRADMDGTQ